MAAIITDQRRQRVAIAPDGRLPGPARQFLQRGRAVGAGRSHRRLDISIRGFRGWNQAGLAFATHLVKYRTFGIARQQKTVGVSCGRD